MRILVIEDEEKVARFVARGLREESYSVEVAGDGPSGLARALSESFDLVVLDVMLPGLDGFGVLRALRAAGSRVRVLMLTARATLEDRVTGLDAGADDYLAKPFAFEEFLARVRALARREVVAPTPVLRLADLVLDPVERTVTRSGQPLTLTVREFQVLHYLLRNAGRTITRTQLSEQIWEASFDLSTNVIDVTIYHLREKLDRSFTPRLIHTIRGVGYRLSAEDAGP